MVMTSKIAQYAARTNVLADSMLSFARETPHQKTSIDVNALLQRALALNRTIENSGIRTKLALEQNAATVLADTGQILQVFMHVISNAVDAMEHSAHKDLLISTKLSGNRMVIEFADSGSGLQQPERVFEPFYTTKPVGKGVGLGLSTCYGIVHSHGGEITCRNGLECGAIFTITLQCESSREPIDGAVAPLASQRSS
jgi:two-component system NtrC family sensor kinase